MKKTMIAAAGVLALGATAAGPAAAQPFTPELYAQGLTAPSGALWLKGTLGGHLWVADHLLGMCRLDASAGPAPFAINQATCVNPGAVGQPAYDPVGQFVYVPDLSSKSAGVTRYRFNPTTERLGTAFIIAANQGVGGDRPQAAALGPDGKVYVGFKKNGNIVRITNPTSQNTAALPQRKESVGRSSDSRRVSALAFAGADLYLAEGGAVTVMSDPGGFADPADNCTGGCQAADAGFGITTPAALAFAAPALYATDTLSVARIDIANEVIEDYITGLVFPSAVAVRLPGTTNAADPGAVFACDDTTAGAGVLTARCWSAPYEPPVL